MSWLDGYMPSEKASVPVQHTGLPTSRDDPRMVETNELVAQYGGNAKAAALALCKQMGLDPQHLPVEILSKLSGR